MAVKRITQPSSEPVLLADVKAQLSIATADTLVDAIITRRITEAREYAESFTGRSIMPCNWEVVLDKFPPEVELFYPPATTIVSVKYIDTTGTEQTLDSANYSLDSDSEPNWLLRAYGVEWPDTLESANAVRVRYTSGYADAASVPGPIKEAIMITIGHWMRYQSAVESGLNITRIPTAVECLLNPYRMYRFG
jgi:uncharacterized phiE125 gp8 family phage protein